MKISDNGREAITAYEVLRQYRDSNGADYSLVLLRLITGRAHQLRAHMAHLGNPIVGDLKYAADPAQLARGKSITGRLFLHGVRLAYCAAQSAQPTVAWCPISLVPRLELALEKLQRTQVD